MLNPFTQSRLPLSGRLFIVLAVGVAYGYYGPEVLAPLRHLPSTIRWLFAFHAVTFIGVVPFVAQCKAKPREIASAALVCLVWIYLFFFVMLNSFGS